jgi:DNA-binding beta-propeller fold protein YncE
VAHPARGIAVSRDGHVYFSDLTRIWRIDGGKRTLIRDNHGHHSHSLIVDASGTVVWEESAYDPATDRYTETIWELGARGPRPRFGPLRSPPLGLGLARDARGCTYRVDLPAQGANGFAVRRCSNERPRLIFGSAAAARAFRPVLINDVAGVAFAPNGNFWFRDNGIVRSVDAAGRMRIIARGLSPDRFGIAADRQGRLLVAEFDRRRVLRIDGARREVVATSATGWAPTGVAVASDSRLFVLEATLYRRGDPLRMQVRQLAPGPPRLIARTTVAE